MRKFAIALAAVAAFAAPTQAAVVFHDTFDGENGGTSKLNYTKFVNFDVTGNNVDIVKSGDFKITCLDGGMCVDLDGTPGDGGLVSKSTFSYLKGDLIELFITASDNQRNAKYAPDDMEYGMYTSTNGTVSALDTIPFGAGWAVYTKSFKASADGELSIFFKTPSADKRGPVVDDVRLEITSVPEAATWAMMLGGFAIVGAATRRRKTAVSFA